MLFWVARARLAAAGLLLALLTAAQSPSWAAATLNRGLGPEPDSLDMR